MITWIVGGAGSGKSAYAERLASARPGRRCYLATMRVRDAESSARVARHRALRAGKGFITLEAPLALADLVLPPCETVLLEDLTNLAANERYDPDGAGAHAAKAVLRAVKTLSGQCAHLILVGNELFCAGRGYDGGTVEYLRMLAEIHRQVAARADNVCEVVAGLPLYYKGREPL